MRTAMKIAISGLVILGFAAIGHANEPCEIATVWADPQVVQYAKIVRDFQDSRTEPNFTVWIELPDGSAVDIDPASVRLNGLEPVDGPTTLDDANQNGIADLMVKFNRSALITTDGALTVTGTKSGGCFTGDATVEIHCRPAEVKRSDYYLDYTTSNMPDPQFNDLPAQLDIHRVTPIFSKTCPDISPIRAIVLVPGRTVPGTAAFDLQYQDYSLMERLALHGIDAYAVNFLGFGFSALKNGNPLDEPCNASLPPCSVPPGGSCTPTATCDCQNTTLLTQNKMDQQGSTRYLNPNPLTARCAHLNDIKKHFDRVTNEGAQLDVVIDDVLAKTGLERAHLLGYSAGGHAVGKYLGDDVSRQSKIAGVIFLDSSGFGGIAGLDEPLLPITTWPLGLIDRTDVMANFNLGGTPCPGQQDPAIGDAIWTAIKSRDPIGPGWGPSDGLSRYPIVSRFLWNPTVASRIEVPALHIHGLKDNVVPPVRGQEIWSSSPLQIPEVACTSDADCDAPKYACRSFPSPARCRLNNRILVQLDCASHALVWEGCTGENCAAPHRIVQKRVVDWVFTGK